MRVTVASTADGCENWLLDLDVDANTTVTDLKQILAAPPHRLGVNASTKVLCRQDGILTTLFDREKVRDHLTLLNVNTDSCFVFPKDFVWGTSTAAYQIEGASHQDGRTSSIWDTFCKVKGKTHNGDTGAVACDHYHRYKEDVAVMKQLSLQSYRFSISWPRLLPAGRGVPNPAAVRFYGDLIDELLASGIKPLVTLYHWDLPQCLEDQYGGWLGREVIDDFAQFAKVCFSLFGDRVKFWITLNEPWCSAVLGYASGEHAPGRSALHESEPYLAAHHLILAHAQAVRCYREEFQSEQAGSIGISLNMDWKEPRTASDSDAQAQRRALDWQLGWFADPIYKGDYPETMRQTCKGRLPHFTEEEIRLVKGSSDFFGLNHYSSDYVSADTKKADGYFSDQQVINTSDPAWPKTDMGWDVVPWGLRRLVTFIHHEYAPAGGIFITENGCAVQEDDSPKAVDDWKRVAYLQGYLAQLYMAIADGADVRGYYVWSFMDNFEWAFGFAKRFGIVRVNYETQERLPKQSGSLISELSKTNTLRVPLRILHASEHAPYGNGQTPHALQRDGGGKGYLESEERSSPNTSGTNTNPLLSIEDAKRLLKDLAVKYEDQEFQEKMCFAYKRNLVTGDELVLAKQIRALCMPIQAGVLPKYGFEPTLRGLAKVTRQLSSKEFLAQDSELAEVSMYVVYLTKDKPQKGAADAATV